MDTSQTQICRGSEPADTTENIEEEETFTVLFNVFGNPASKERPRTVNKVDRYGRVKSSHTYTPKKTKDYEEGIGWAYKSHYGRKRFPDGVPLAMSIDFYVGVPAKAKKAEKDKMLKGIIRPTTGKDVDNMAKAVLDGLNGVAYKDDSQVVELTCRKFYSVNPRVEIAIARSK